jgi:osmotically-inducible protein OsmY
MFEAGLNDRVLTALGQNPYLLGRKLRFESEHGRITLRGEVRSYFQKQMAQESLRRIDGVEDIRNELEVVPPEPYPRQRAG